MAGIPESYRGFSRLLRHRKTPKRCGPNWPISSWAPKGISFLPNRTRRWPPPQEPDFNDSAALNRLYYIHDKKMALLNQAVYALIKVQDLVDRLLHESLGGDVVDTSNPDWEEDNLKRVTVLKGLDRKRTMGELSSADFMAISNAFQAAKNTQKRDLTKSYRNRLMHHVRPSVDYAMFYAYVNSRLGTEIRDQQGN